MYGRGHTRPTKDVYCCGIQQYVAGRAMQRAQHPDDVTGAVVFLLGQGAGFVTGQLLPVNGGFVFN